MAEPFPSSALATPGAPTSVHDLKTLVLSRYPAIAIESSEEERVEQLVHAVASDLRMTVFEWTPTQGLVRLPGDQAVYGSAEAAKAVGAMGELALESIYLLHDFAGHLSNPVVSRAFRELLERFSSPARMSTIVLAGAAIDLPAEVDPHVVRYELRLPDRAEYRRTIMAVVESLQANRRAAIEIGAADYDDFADAVSGLTLNQARQSLARVAIDDGRLGREDVAQLVQLKAEALRHDALLEYYPPSDNAYELGGFENLGRWLDRAKVGFTPEAAALNLAPPRGLLLVGVQGCGKSLAAKAIARRWDLPLLKLDAGRLYDKYVGESERNMRKATATAEAMSPCVLWIDEIEKALASGGQDSSDGGLSRRLFGYFLTWLQEKRDEVFVVATANDLSALPPELLRKGRFDEIFFVDLPDAAEREQILRIHLGLRHQDPAGIDLPSVVTATEGFSGAEIEQTVIASLLQSLQEKRPLDAGLLVAEAGATVPLSVSRREDIDRLRAHARERFTPVR
jgi:hypothetical protein